MKSSPLVLQHTFAGMATSPPLDDGDDNISSVLATSALHRNAVLTSIQQDKSDVSAKTCSRNHYHYCAVSGYVPYKLLVLHIVQYLRSAHLICFCIFLHKLS